MRPEKSGRYRYFLRLLSVESLIRTVDQQIRMGNIPMQWDFTVAKEKQVLLIDLNKMSAGLSEKYGPEKSTSLFVWV